VGFFGGADLDFVDVTFETAPRRDVLVTAVAGISLVFLPAGEVSIAASREGIAKATEEGVEIVGSIIEGAEVQVTYRRWPKIDTRQKDQVQVAH
jgi:hypothetical protein